MYWRLPMRNGSSASRWSSSGVIGFLYLRARVHSALQVDASSTLSRVSTKSRPSQSRIASASCASQSRTGSRWRRSSQTGQEGGPAVSASAQLERELGAVEGGVADEVVEWHGWAFAGDRVKR